MNISSKNIESQWISLKLPNLREIIIINLYRPPQGSITEFCEKLNDDLSSFDPTKKREFYLMGDFNIDTMDKTTDEYKELNSLINSYGLMQHINDITRFSKNNSCIDNIFSNCDIINDSGTLNWNFSDHQAVFVNPFNPIRPYMASIQLLPHIPRDIWQLCHKYLLCNPACCFILFLIP